MTRRADDTEDVEQLLVAFAPRVYGLLLRMVGRPDVAEDLVQETALRVVRRLDTYRPEGKFQAWIFCIAVNLARDWMRRQPRTPASLPSDTDDGSPGP
ncbi:MAG: sigma-70 family RNA polymerase sigma factor, partial [Acidobacteria bacterium]|nr:sigma-70 family RNA polymerase sigma factor [Acidobacteriota bacterium]